MTVTASAGDLDVKRFPARDGKLLAYREIGDGRPVILLHGFISNGVVNWIRYGHAGAIAATGRRVVIPDLRGHGDSAEFGIAGAYPPDVLADDGLALIEHLRLVDHDLVGYSLGARTVIRMLVRGDKARRAVVAGTGLEPILHAAGRANHYLRILEPGAASVPGSEGWRVQQFLRSVGADANAVLPVLETLVDTPLDALGRIEIPVLVLAGESDDDHGSVEALAGGLPHARLQRVPGDHMSAVARPELGAAIAAFLAEQGVS
jgi:pimeloyl-ACP methyl ester carboxylesterase